MKTSPWNIEIDGHALVHVSVHRKLTPSEVRELVSDLQQKQRDAESAEHRLAAQFIVDMRTNALKGKL